MYHLFSLLKSILSLEKFSKASRLYDTVDEVYSFLTETFI